MPSPSSRSRWSPVSLRSMAGSLAAGVTPFLTRPVRVLRDYDRSLLAGDAMAGLTVGVILLPQAIAFALIAGLPPSAGLYTAVVGAVVGALWGSSAHLHNGPTSAVSLLVLSSVSASVAGAEDLVLAAGLLAVMAGLVQLLMGVARLGMLVNFVSDAVVVGFAAGAGIQIAAGELRHLVGVEVQSRHLVDVLWTVAAAVPDWHLPTTAIGVGSLVVIAGLKRWRPALPATLIALVAASGVLAVFGLAESGTSGRAVAVLGALPSSPPTPQALPLNLDLIAELSTGALAVAAIGLIQTMAVARSLAAQTGTRLDSNQEFVGQGLANVACGWLSGYPSSGSFSRSAVNLEAGASSPVAAVFSGAFVLGAMLFLGALTAYLPRAALSGALILVAYGMIDRAAIARIARATSGETLIMAVTLFGTLFLPIEFAVLAGILMSLGFYILKTSVPRVEAVQPDAAFRHFTARSNRAPCPQLGILEVHGDLYFGATSHVEDAIRDHRDAHPEQRYLLLRLGGVNHCDFSGIRMLESVVRSYRDDGGDVFVTRTQRPVLRMMISSAFHERLGRDHFLPPDQAIGYLFHRIIDPAICIYECDARAFQECQNLPRPEFSVELPVVSLPPASAGTVGDGTVGDGATGSETTSPIPLVAPDVLWRELREGSPAGAGGTARSRPRILDVREPREYRQGHIQGAELYPLPRLLDDPPRLHTADVVLVCMSGRRSTRAAHVLRSHGCTGLRILDGGMRAWSAKGYLEAVG